MKTKTSKIKTKLLELYLIKSRTYEKFNKNIKNITHIPVDQTLINFKKVLRIIFKFNRKNKKILFLGFNGLILKKINKETKHIAVPSKMLLQGLFSNKLKFKNTFKYSLLKMKQKPDLVVVFDKIETYSSILSESFTAKIPTIIFDESLNTRKTVCLYKVPANIEFLLNNKSLFYNCLKFLFKPLKLNSTKVTQYAKKKI